MSQDKRPSVQFSDSPLIKVNGAPKTNASTKNSNNSTLKAAEQKSDSRRRRSSTIEIPDNIAEKGARGRRSSRVDVPPDARGRRYSRVGADIGRGKYIQWVSA